MPVLALADALTDFGGQPRPAARTVPSAHTAAKPALEPMGTPAQAVPDRIEVAVEAAKAELSARLETEHADALEALREEHKQEVARLHAEFGERAGTELASRIGEMQDRLVSLTSSVAARILGIAMTEDVQRAALESLASAIKGAARDREAVRITLRGPLSLYEALTPLLGPLAEQVEFAESSVFDLTAVIDDAVFETRLSDWSASLSEIMT
jgi:hypothetical protein